MIILKNFLVESIYFIKIYLKKVKLILNILFRNIFCSFGTSGKSGKNSQWKFTDKLLLLLQKNIFHEKKEQRSSFSLS